MSLISESWMKQYLLIDEMCLFMDLSVWKITPRFFALSLGEIVLELIFIMLTGRFSLFGLNRRYSILFGLTNNLFDIINENTSLIQDLIIEKADEANSGENDE